MGITGVDYNNSGYGYDWQTKRPDEKAHGAGQNIDDDRDGNQEPDITMFSLRRHHNVLRFLL